MDIGNPVARTFGPQGDKLAKNRAVAAKAPE
jgi:hypothetical protein